jgi:hypothetical protein
MGLTFYCVLSGSNAAKIYILSSAILNQEILRALVALGGGAFWAGGPGKTAPAPPLGGPEKISTL